MSVERLDLSRPCDSCGDVIGAGFKFCPKCHIYLCQVCWYNLLHSQDGAKLLTCPMCDEKLKAPYLHP